MEKILECLDEKICNINPSLRQQLIEELISNDIADNVAKCKVFLTQKLSIPITGRHTRGYWLSRGWSEAESHFYAKENVVKRCGWKSPFSKDFWMDKINPDTGVFYTQEEAIFCANSRRPIKEEYWLVRGHTLEESIELAKRKKSKNNKTGAATAKERKHIYRSTSKRCKEYWLLRGYDDDASTKKVTEHQRTFSLSICIEKYGEEKGKKVWSERQMKWLKSYKKSNFSKISQQLFWSISTRLQDLETIYFAELDPSKKPDMSGRNNEYRLKDGHIVLMPDFIDTRSRKIIEFDGVYWHGKGRGNKRREEDRDNVLKEHGYLVMHVDESEFRKNPDLVIEKCITFLTQ